MSATFAHAKASRIAEALNIDSADPRFAQYVNEAEQRMLHRGHYWGAYGRYVLDVDSQLLTTPSYLDTLDGVAVNNQLLDLRTLWFEFLGNGAGTRQDTDPNPMSECLFRGSYPVLRDIATATKMRAMCDLVSDVGKIVTIHGMDENKNWVRTQVSGVWINGEQVALAQSPGTETATTFSKITAISAPDDLDGQWWLYDTTNTTLYGRYQHWETAPSWKRYLIPFLPNTTTTAEVIGLRAFIPVKNDGDFLIIGNLAALKLACMAIKAEEEHSWDESNRLWNGTKDASGKITYIGAIQELEMELQHHIGDGVKFSVNVQNAPGFSEPVPTLV